MEFYYQLPGFFLKITQREDGRWVLIINRVAYGVYHSPQQAADDAAVQVTGDEAYDSSPQCASADLDDWLEC